MKKCSAIKRTHLSTAVGNAHQRINEWISQKGAQVKAKTIASDATVWYTAICGGKNAILKL